MISLLQELDEYETILSDFSIVQSREKERPVRAMCINVPFQYRQAEAEKKPKNEMVTMKVLWQLSCCNNEEKFK